MTQEPNDLVYTQVYDFFRLLFPVSADTCLLDTALSLRLFGLTIPNGNRITLTPVPGEASNFDTTIPPLNVSDTSPVSSK